MNLHKLRLRGSRIIASFRTGKSWSHILKLSGMAAITVSASGVNGHVSALVGGIFVLLMGMAVEK